MHGHTEEHELLFDLLEVLLHARSRTQVQISLSSPESEFYGCCGAAAELLYC